MLLSFDRITYFTFMFLLTYQVPFVSSSFAPIQTMLLFAQVRSDPGMFLLTRECYLVPSRSFLLILECFFSTCIRIRYHHSPGKEKKQCPRKEIDTNQKNLHVSFDIACFFFVFVIPVRSRRCSSSPRSDLI